MKLKINLSESFVHSLAKNFEREHSKFITESCLKLEDLNKEFMINGEKFKILGMYEIREILIQSEITGKMFVEKHGVVSSHLNKVK